MSLTFPNPGWSYDASVSAVRFQGHDSAKEAAHD